MGGVEGSCVHLFTHLSTSKRTEFKCRAGVVEQRGGAREVPSIGERADLKCRMPQSTCIVKCRVGVLQAKQSQGRLYGGGAAWAGP